MFVVAVQAQAGDIRKQEQDSLPVKRRERASPPGLLPERGVRLIPAPKQPVYLQAQSVYLPA